MNDQGMHILLVEDEKAHVELVCRAFESHPRQFHLTVAGNLQEAQACLAESWPDLVIADLLLPDGRGTELLPSGDEAHRFPVVVMTSHGDEQVAVEAMKAGALDYVVKSAATLVNMPRIAERAVREWGHIKERERAEEQIKAALAEKEVLLREIHHRVKNNLQVIIYLIDMQADQITDPQVVQMLKELQERARVMALVHEQLYRSQDLAQIDFGTYLQDLTANLRYAFETGQLVALRVNADAVSMGVDKAIPCGLTVNELVTNALKHAFPEDWDREREIEVEFRLQEGEYVLTVSDNGVGLPPELDWRATRSLGLRLVNLWAAYQLRGSIQVDTWPRSKQGTTFTIKFPK